MASLEIILVDAAGHVMPEVREGFWPRAPADEVSVARSFRGRFFPAVPADDAGSVLAFPARKLPVVHLLVSLEEA